MWEIGWFKQILATGSNETVEKLAKKTGLEALKPIRHDEYVAPASAVETAKPISFVKQRLLLARLIKTEDTIRHGALRKLRHIILQDLDQCGLGKTLKHHAGKFSQESTLHYNTFLASTLPSSIGLFFLVWGIVHSCGVGGDGRVNTAVFQRCSHLTQPL